MKLYSAFSCLLFLSSTGMVAMQQPPATAASSTSAANQFSAVPRPVVLRDNLFDPTILPSSSPSRDLQQPLTLGYLREVLATMQRRPSSRIVSSQHTVTASPQRVGSGAKKGGNDALIDQELRKFIGLADKDPNITNDDVEEFELFLESLNNDERAELAEFAQTLG